jgi:type III secretion protein Q
MQAIRPLLDAVDPDTVALHNRLQARRQSVQVNCAGQAITLTCAAALGAAATEVCPLWLSSGELSARLLLPCSLRDRLLASQGVLEVFEDLATAAQSILLEQALLPLLEPLEAELDQRLTVDVQGNADVMLPLTLRLGVQVADGESHTLMIELSVAAAQIVTDLLDRMLPPQPQKLPGLILPLVLQAGWQALSISELRSLRLGDVLMLEVPGNADLWVSLANSRWARARREEQGIRLLEAINRSQPIREYPMSQGTSSHGATNQSAEEESVDASLGDVQLNLVCQVGSVQLSLAELQQLGEGSVLALPEGGSDFVELLVNGRSVGRGELVRMGDGVGVRLTRFASL